MRREILEGESPDFPGLGTAADSTFMRAFVFEPI